MKKSEKPLAYRLRPRSLEEFIGQEHLVAPGKFIYQIIARKKPVSAILYGPPGTGKTSLARILADSWKLLFVQLDAANSSVAELRKVLQEAAERRRFYREPLLLFIDEIHRFNKAQQDVLLPALEEGAVVLLGATTENPFYELNPPLISRTRVLPFYSLKGNHLEKVLNRALQDCERGLGSLNIELTSEARALLIRSSGGDARVLLNNLETALALVIPRADDLILLEEEAVSSAIQKKIILYDKSGDEHYDTLSAFIKSMRGSDPDATVYWLAKMLKAGEDPRLIARRVLICAAEDVGLADPQALVVASAAAQGFEHVGLPEGRLLLVEAALYVASAPKSNRSYLALHKAYKDLEKGYCSRVPDHLRERKSAGAKALGRGKGYLYPHDYPGSQVYQRYLPKELQGKKYYVPSDEGEEKNIKNRLKNWKK